MDPSLLYLPTYEGITSTEGLEGRIRLIGEAVGAESWAMGVSKFVFHMPQDPGHVYKLPVYGCDDVYDDCSYTFRGSDPSRHGIRRPKGWDGRDYCALEASVTSRAVRYRRWRCFLCPTELHAYTVRGIPLYRSPAMDSPVPEDPPVEVPAPSRVTDSEGLDSYLFEAWGCDLDLWRRFSRFCRNLALVDLYDGNFMLDGDGRPLLVDAAGFYDVVF